MLLYILLSTLIVLALANLFLLIGLMTFMVRQADVQRQIQEETMLTPSATPTLEISEGDNIPEEVLTAQVPYHSRPRGTLDRGF